jgi:hypothetical protein
MWDEIRRACSTYGTGVYTKCWQEILKEIDPYVDIHIDGRIILK